MPIRHGNYRPNDLPVYMEGYLHKKEKRNRWVELWAILEGNILKFQKHKLKNENVGNQLIGWIELTKDTRCYLEKKKDYSFPFYIKKPGKKYLFKTSCTLSRHRWAKAIALSVEGKSPRTVPKGLSDVNRNCNVDSSFSEWTSEEEEEHMQVTNEIDPDQNNRMSSKTKRGINSHPSKNYKTRIPWKSGISSNYQPSKISNKNDPNLQYKLDRVTEKKNQSLSNRISKSNGYLPIKNSSLNLKNRKYCGNVSQFPSACNSVERKHSLRQSLKTNIIKNDPVNSFNQREDNSDDKENNAVKRNSMKSPPFSINSTVIRKAPISAKTDISNVKTTKFPNQVKKIPIDANTCSTIRQMPCKESKTNGDVIDGFDSNEGINDKDRIKSVRDSAMKLQKIDNLINISSSIIKKDEPAKINKVLLENSDGITKYSPGTRKQNDLKHISFTSFDRKYTRSNIEGSTNHSSYPIAGKNAEPINEKIEFNRGPLREGIVKIEQSNIKQNLKRAGKKSPDIDASENKIRQIDKEKPRKSLIPVPNRIKKARGRVAVPIKAKTKLRKSVEGKQCSRSDTTTHDSSCRTPTSNCSEGENGHNKVRKPSIKTSNLPQTHSVTNRSDMPDILQLTNIPTQNSVKTKRLNNFVSLKPTAYDESNMCIRNESFIARTKDELFKNRNDAVCSKNKSQTCRPSSSTKTINLDDRKKSITCPRDGSANASSEVYIEERKNSCEQNISNNTKAKIDCPENKTATSRRKESVISSSFTNDNRVYNSTTSGINLRKREPISVPEARKTEQTILRDKNISNVCEKPISSVNLRQTSKSKEAVKSILNNGQEFGSRKETNDHIVSESSLRSKEHKKCGKAESSELKISNLNEGNNYAKCWPEHMLQARKSKEEIVLPAQFVTNRILTDSKIITETTEDETFGENDYNKLSHLDYLLPGQQILENILPPSHKKTANTPTVAEVFTPCTPLSEARRKPLTDEKVQSFELNSVLSEKNILAHSSRPNYYKTHTDAFSYHNHIVNEISASPTGLIFPKAMKISLKSDVDKLTEYSYSDLEEASESCPPWLHIDTENVSSVNQYNFDVLPSRNPDRFKATSILSVEAQKTCNPTMVTKTSTIPSNVPSTPSTKLHNIRSSHETPSLRKSLNLLQNKNTTQLPPNSRESFLYPSDMVNETAICLSAPCRRGCTTMKDIQVDLSPMKDRNMQPQHDDPIAAKIAPDHSERTLTRCDDMITQNLLNSDELGISRHTSKISKDYSPLNSCIVSKNKPFPSISEEKVAKWNKRNPDGCKSPSTNPLANIKVLPAEKISIANAKSNGLYTSSYQNLKNGISTNETSTFVNKEIRRKANNQVDSELTDKLKEILIKGDIFGNMTYINYDVQKLLSKERHGIKGKVLDRLFYIVTNR